MTESESFAQLPAPVREKLQDFLSRFSGSGAARYMWRELMTEADRKRIKHEVDKEPHDALIDDTKGTSYQLVEMEIKDGLAGSVLHRAYNRWGAVGMWMKLKRLTLLLALVDLARQGGLPDAERDRLLAAIGEKPPAKRPSKLPIWDREKGILRFEGAVVRKIASLNRARNIVDILDRFEQEGWKQKVASMFEGQMLHYAVATLNKDLKRIRFHACDDGKSIRWARQRSSSHLRVSFDRASKNRKS